MRNRVVGQMLKVRAVAGLHVVTLGWDFLKPQEAQSIDLMGFAIQRSTVEADGSLTDTHWLSGIKRFKNKDTLLPPGTLVPTSEHPVQSFQWGDYTARSGTYYEYTVVPVRGAPMNCAPAVGEETVVRVETERSRAGNAAQGAKHDVYFNRGVAGSQTYSRMFGLKKPDQTRPKSEQMAWLSRGLYEALIDFIGCAAGPDASDYALRAMFYEFQYKPVGMALKKAARAGADVDIRYENQSYRDHNEGMIEEAGIGDICTAQRSRAGIRHNKFIVLLHHGDPVAVWTGSTNISAGGIFGHSNVGHVIRDGDIARRFLDYWEALADPQVTTGSLVTRNMAVEPTPAAADKPPADRIMTLFSPRDEKDPDTTTPTMEWYARLLSSAREIACMTFAFNFDPVFQKAVAGETDALSYLVFDKALDDQRETEVRRNRNTIIAAGGKLEPGDLELFLGESLTGFNRNRYIHDKFLLVDPLSDDPIIVTGTANFSENSQDTNDENMLVIRGDTRVADIYFGEFMRIFDHHYSRYIIAKLRAEGKQNPDAGYLKPATADWAPAHFSGSKDKRRRFFS